MNFTQCPLDGAYVIDVERHHDERGFFGRTFCTAELRAKGIEFPVVQCNVSFNYKRGTLRGMHYQIAPSEEAKIVRCTRGAILDVIVDIRPESPTRGRHFSVELTEENQRGLYIPIGFAHGFQTLADETEVFYHMSEMFSPGHARGLRWNDSTLAIAWPLPVSVISAKDAAYDDFVA